MMSLRRECIRRPRNFPSALSGAGRPRRRSSFHSIPASGFGGIESLIGAAKESLAIESFFFALLHGGKSEAESDWKPAHTGFDRLIGNAVAQPFRTDDQI